jgi:hypothetical protein
MPAREIVIAPTSQTFFRTIVRSTHVTALAHFDHVLVQPLYCGTAGGHKEEWKEPVNETGH